MNQSKLISEALDCVWGFVFGGAMIASSACLQLILTSEGCVLVPYRDAGSRWTVGVGHLLSEFEPIASISYDDAMRLFHEDVGIAERAVEALTVGCTLTQGMFDALVSFVFNLGREALEHSTLLRLLRAGDIQGAAGEFPKWDHCDGVVLPGLAKRRLAERSMFLNEMPLLSA